MSMLFAVNSGKARDQPDESGNFVIKRQSTSEIAARDQHTGTGKRKAQPEAQTLRKRHQTWESETDSRKRYQTCESKVASESNSSWQSKEEEDGKDYGDYKEEDHEEEDDEKEDK
ncbi:hypothetical protein BGZ79_009488 [Entomortierella chlamydospora]|nr:hypothetical protein BGZ79_009488 [Entomortierella chlamydospora]